MESRRWAGGLQFALTVGAETAIRVQSSGKAAATRIWLNLPPRGAMLPL
jgi:hypothetical protein